MTRDQISAKIRFELDDLGVTYYSHDDLDESIQDAYDEIVVYTECIEKQITLDFISNTTYYDFSTLIPDYYRLISVFHNNLNSFMEGSNERNQFSYRNDWELGNYQSREFIILSPKYVGFSGRQSTALGDFRVLYKATANTLIFSSVPLISENYLNLINLYVTADLLEQNEEFQKASKYWSQYDPMLEEYRKKIQLLAKSDRVFTRV